MALYYSMPKPLLFVVLRKSIYSFICMAQVFAWHSDSADLVNLLRLAINTAHFVLCVLLVSVLALCDPSSLIPAGWGPASAL